MPTARPATPKTVRRPSIRERIDRLSPRARRFLRIGLWSVAGITAFVLLMSGYFWVKYGRLIEQGMAGEQHPVPRIFGRPFDLHAGLGLSPSQLVQRLNDLGYTERPKAEHPGEFARASTGSVTLIPRQAGDTAPSVRVDFTRGPASTIAKIVDPKNKPVAHVGLEAPMLAALAQGQKRRNVPLASIPKPVVDAVIAIEDRRFYDHPGIDVIRSVGAILTNLRGDKPYLVGGSTLTQQIVKNMFLTPEKTLRRKVQEQFMALVLESRYTKDQILELYLNSVTLGQRGPFEIHGVAEAARIFFGKDLRNVTVAEAATMAGLIQSPSRLSPFRNPERARERRNVVLNEMADAGFITRESATKAAAEPLTISARALENEAPYFVDYVSQLVDDQYSGMLKKDAAVDVYTTLDLQLQRFAQEAVGDGIAQVDKQLAAKKRPGEAQAALVAIDPQTGEILAMVGGRAYNQSQYNRAVLAKRQPGSAFKPFVYLAAFEKMAAEGRSDFTPATIEVDEPTVFKDGDNDYAPTNYQNEYDGPVTLRRALAHSRNIVAIKVAQATGYDRVADLWKKADPDSAARPYPAIALGVFEATPLEMVNAYTVFTNGGTERPLVAISSLTENGKAQKLRVDPTRPVARADTTYLVTNMMRSVLNEGTGAGARSAGFTRDAAGKSGTTNDLRDAWFIGFTPQLLTVVWVGFDDNKPIGLSGSQAALPIWTAFMKRALAAQPEATFQVPPGVVFVEIDKDTGKLAMPNCPRTMSESFLADAVPHEYCDVHGGHVGAALARFGAWFKRIIR
jgi:penicillin-binding protein 1B